MAYESFIDYYLAAARGIGSVSSIHKFGRSEGIGLSETTVWDGSVAYQYTSAAETLRLVSSEAADATAGAGAITVNIQGLDSNYALQTETVALSGITPNTLTNQYLRVFRMKVVSAGAAGWNTGTVYLFRDQDTVTAGTGIPTTTANQVAQIKPKRNQTLMAVYTVPANCTAYLDKIYADTGKGKDGRITMYRRDNENSEPFQVKESFNTYEGHTGFEHKLPVKVTQKTDIEIRAESSATGAIINAGFDMLLINANE